jgi:glycosyltransferase involved in cell wall biosynthesis
MPVVWNSAGSDGLLAVCMIVRNESDFLRNALRSLGRIHEALYVTDTGSEDDSVSVAAAAGAVVRHFRWGGDFAAARNASIAGVREQWILMLDADDEFPEGEAEKLREMLHGAGPEVMAATVSYECHRDHTPMRAVRLLRNVRGLRYRGRIHEYPDFGQPLRANQVRHFPVRLVHRGEMPGDAAGNKDRRNLPLLSAEWEVAMESGSVERRMDIGSSLAQTLAALGDGRGAVQLISVLLRPILAGEWREFPVRPVLRAWVRWLHVLGMHEGTQSVLRTACDAEYALGKTVVYALHRGLAEIAAGRMPGAVPWLESFAQRCDAPEIPVPLNCLGARLELMLASCHQAAGNRDRVTHHCRRAMEAEPDDFETQLRVRLLTGGAMTYAGI